MLTNQLLENREFHMAIEVLPRNESTALVEKIRTEIRGLDFKPLDDQALTEMRAAIEAAVKSAEIEDSHRTPAEVALHKMLLEERAPEEVRRFAVRRFLEGTVSDGRSLAGTVFSVALIAAFTLLGATLNPATAMAASSRDGAAKKSLFIAVPYPSTSALINDLNHICNEHKDPGQEDYIFNAVVQNVADANGAINGPRKTHLDILVQYFPGGSTPCFDNAFIGTVYRDWDWRNRTNTGQRQSWCWQSRYCGGILDEAFRWENINASAVAASNFKSMYPGINVHWYVTYEANLVWFGNTGYSTSIRQAYEAYLIGLINVLQPYYGTSAVVWSPAFWSKYYSVPYSSRVNIKNQLNTMFWNVKAYTNGRGVDWLHFQDFMGQAPGSMTTTDVRRWYNLLNSMSYNFASLRVNMEQFGTNVLEHMERENNYDASGIPVGASFSMRSWSNATFGVLSHKDL